jgi:hypothetical protein
MWESASKFIDEVAKSQSITLGERVKKKANTCLLYSDWETDVMPKNGMEKLSFQILLYRREAGGEENTALDLVFDEIDLYKFV